MNTYSEMDIKIMFRFEHNTKLTMEAEERIDRDGLNNVRYVLYLSLCLILPGQVSLIWKRNNNNN